MSGPANDASVRSEATIPVTVAMIDSDQPQLVASGFTGTSNSTQIVNRSWIGRKSGQVRVTLSDMVRVLRADNEAEQVSMEQIQRVRNMHEKFSEGSKLSFNYNTLLVVASILAGLGLASDSSTTIIASMLVSPLMGPVAGMAYGATIYDWALCRRAFYTETVSLLFCIFCGAMICTVTGPLDIGSVWPTNEMIVRGSWQNFLVALPVAFFSGIGVSVSMLDDQTSSLVGVAISASLLPPAVNAGVLWVAWTFAESGNLGSRLPIIAPISTQHSDGSEDQDPVYNAKDYWLRGTISLCLTLANIALIIVASVATFRLKERLPVKKSVFWTDLGVARKIYRDLAVIDVEGTLDDDQLFAVEEGLVEDEQQDEARNAENGDAPTQVSNNNS